MFQKWRIIPDTNPHTYWVCELVNLKSLANELAVFESELSSLSDLFFCNIERNSSNAHLKAWKQDFRNP